MGDKNKGYGFFVVETALPARQFDYRAGEPGLLGNNLVILRDELPAALVPAIDAEDVQVISTALARVDVNLEYEG
jgi:hypothetical protein